MRSNRWCVLTLLGCVLACSAPSAARAGLDITLFDEAGDLKVEVSGRLAVLPEPADQGKCGITGALFGQFESKPNTNYPIICTGPNLQLELYNIVSALAGFGGSAALAPATGVSGSPFWFSTSAYNGPPKYLSVVGLPSSYVPGDSFFSAATFAGTSLAEQGFTGQGLVGSWQLVGAESEVIHVILGKPAVPGPLPLLGLGAALNWSRRLRRRRDRATGRGSRTTAG